MEIVVREQKNLTEQVVDILQNKILKNHYEVLKNKAAYNAAVKACEREQSFDGCVFKKIFRPIFDNALEGIPLDQHQLRAIWERLGKIMNTSRSKNFFYSAADVDLHRNNLAIEEIKVMDYIAKCVRHQKERFTHIYPGLCKSVTKDILEDIGYDDVSAEFSYQVYSSFLVNGEYFKIIKSFSEQVTARDFTCLLANPICENNRYKRLLELWNYGRTLTPSQQNDFIKGLVRKHKR